MRGSGCGIPGVCGSRDTDTVPKNRLPNSYSLINGQMWYNVQNTSWRLKLFPSMLETEGTQQILNFLITCLSGSFDAH